VDLFDRKVALDFEKILPSPAYMQGDKSLIDDWHVMHWDVPACAHSYENYDASDEMDYPGVTRIVFITGGEPPLPVIAKLAEMYPDLEFELTYFEGGMYLAGRSRWNDGTAIESQVVEEKTPDSIIAFFDEADLSLSEYARHVYGIAGREDP